MNTEKQRIAIAGFCGFYDFKTKTVLDGETFPIAKLKEGFKHPFDWEPWVDGCYSIPNYPNDLNAMHEAEKCLNQKQTFSYNQLLEMMAAKNSIKDKYPSSGYKYHLTVNEKSEAFLRTIGKWEE